MVYGARKKNAQDIGHLQKKSVSCVKEFKQRRFQAWATGRGVEAKLGIVHFVEWDSQEGILVEEAVSFKFLRRGES